MATSESSDGNGGFRARDAMDQATEEGEAGPEPQNLVTLWYRVWLAGDYRDVLISWCRSIIGSSFIIKVIGEKETQLSKCRADLPPLVFWKRQCRKAFEVDGVAVELLWDCSHAKFDSGPEPCGSFYVAVVCQGEICLLLGDMEAEARRRLREATDCPHVAMLVAKREHVFGRKLCESRARFVPGGPEHLLQVRCGRQLGGLVLSVSVDGEVKLEVQHLLWQFRGNRTITVDGETVELFWDIYNWLYGVYAGFGTFTFCTTKPHPVHHLGDGFDETCINDTLEWMPDWSGTEKKAYAKAWTWEHHVGPMGTREHRNPGFSLTLIAWRHDLRLLARDCV